MHVFGPAKNKTGKQNEKTKINAWVLGKDIEAFGILKVDTGTRLGFEPASGPDTLSLPLPAQSNMSALLNAT